MVDIRFRMYFDDEPATQEQLDLVEEITVEQEIDMAWEAKVRMPLRVDEQGEWQGASDPSMQAFARVRVEVKVGEGAWVPLIDGPVVGHDSNRSAEPGQSTIDLIVQDDSVYLNRQEIQDLFDNRADHEIAEQLFNSVPEIADTDIEEAAPRSDSLPPAVVQRGTAIQLLRQLARCQAMHVYVLPGENAGESVGCFKRLTDTPSDLPAMVMLGAERNIESFNIRNEAQRPGDVQAYNLNVSDKGVVSGTYRYRDVNLLGEDPVVDENTTQQSQATRVAPSGLCNSVDPDRRAEAEAERASFAFQATGSVITDCYQDVLLPYKLVAVGAVGDRERGQYLIKSVTHKLTRSQYTQDFVLTRNARSESRASQSADLIGALV